MIYMLFFYQQNTNLMNTFLSIRQNINLFNGFLRISMYYMGTVCARKYNNRGIKLSMKTQFSAENLA